MSLEWALATAVISGSGFSGCNPRFTLSAFTRCSKFSPIFGEAAKETMNRLTVKPNSNETVELRFTVENPKPRPDLEAKMLQLVNAERVKRGLQPLKPDPEMTAVARAHSKDMFARGYFSHYTPEKKRSF